MSNAKKNAPHVSRLFQNAQDDGTLSGSSLQALNVVDIGAQIQAGLGVSVDDVSASEVLLVTMMPDDSGSIRFSGNAKAIRSGHNLVLDALLTSKQNEGILVHNRYLNGHVLYPYCPLSDAQMMTSQNYDPREGTPLYDQTVVLLGTVLAKAQEFVDNGVAVRTVTLILSDGSDQHSSRASASHVATLANDMLTAENHTLVAMGVDDGATDFRKVFSEMGIRPEWILTPGNSASEIRRAFHVFSQSAVLVAGGRTGQSQGALGGFLAN